jgi:glycosyltransferase involved in cell wall biosynthesis
VSRSSLGQQQPNAAVFSVVMPAYNAEATIDEALESVLAQTFSAWELAVVDDGSADTTLQKAEAFAARDARIQVITQQNAGAGAARARAISATHARFILQLDADDVLLPRCLETYAAFIGAHPSRDIYSCDAEVFGPQGSLSRYYSDVLSLDAKPEFLLEDLIEQCVILNPASVISRALYERVGGIRPGAFTEDYDMWLRALARGGRHIMIPEVLVRYRVGPSQRTASGLQFIEGSAEALQHLAASGVLDGRLTRLAAASARRYALLARRHRAVAAREELEESLCRGDLRRARSSFVSGRLAYGSGVKFALGLAVVMLSPRLYAAILRWRLGKAGLSGDPDGSSGTHHAVPPTASRR